MADLSNLLSDVYGEAAPPAAPEPPAWADDAKLDEVFSDWQPGPSDDAPRAERAVVGESGGLVGALHARAAGTTSGSPEPAVAAPIAVPDLPEPVAEAADAKPAGGAPLDDDLAAALSAALAAAPPPAPPAPTPAAPPTVRESLEDALFDAFAPIATPPAVEPGAEERAPVAPVAVTTVAATEPEPARAWQRADDDILPRGGRRRTNKGFRLRSRR